MRSQSLHIQTPLIESLPLSRHSRKRIFIKVESMQPSGSFKIRGIGRLCTEEVLKGAKKFVCSSGGNAGLAVAYASRKLSVPAVVCVPETTSAMMIEKLEVEGATVHVHGKNWNETDPFARAIAEEEGTVYIPPFDHPLIWEGNATLIHEAADTCPKPDAVIVAVGGGGLFCGIVQGMHDVGWEDVPVVAVETEGAASFSRAIAENKIVALDRIDTIATSLGATRVAKQALEWTHSHKVHSVVVNDNAAADAVIRFANDHRLLVEPACGAALSLPYLRHNALNKYDTILVVACGGAGVSIKMVQDWAERFSIPITAKGEK